MEHTKRPAAKRPTVEQARIIRRRLEEARDDLSVFLDPENPDCSVSPGARRESANYLHIWVMAQIEQSLEIFDRMEIR